VRKSSALCVHFCWRVRAVGYAEDAFFFSLLKSMHSHQTQPFALLSCHICDPEMLKRSLRLNSSCDSVAHFSGLLPIECTICICVFFCVGQTVSTGSGVFVLWLNKTFALKNVKAYYKQPLSVMLRVVLALV